MLNFDTSLILTGFKRKLLLNIVSNLNIIYVYLQRIAFYLTGLPHHFMMRIQ